MAASKTARNPRPAPKATKGTKGKKTTVKTQPSPGKPVVKAKGTGVLGAIEAALTSASDKSPLTKPDLLAKLVKQFPDREATAMQRTINCQVPTRMSRERGIKIVKH